MACDSGDLWLHHNQVAAALKDEEVLSASCPLSMAGELKTREHPRKVFFFFYSVIRLSFLSLFTWCCLHCLWQVVFLWISGGCLLCSTLSSICALLRDWVPKKPSNCSMSCFRQQSQPEFSPAKALSTHPGHLHLITLRSEWFSSCSLSWKSMQIHIRCYTSLLCSYILYGAAIK